MFELNERQKKAAILLADGITPTDVARIMKVTLETISEWREEAGFCAYENRLRNQLHQAARDKLLKLSPLAVKVLEHLILHGSTEEIQRKASLNILVLTGHMDPKKYQAEFRSESPSEIMLGRAL